MTETLYDTLINRGYIAQTSNEYAVRNLLDTPPVTIYQGFDPTRSSLHVGHLQSLMVLHYLQQAGHHVIYVNGGGTTLVGDPVGRNTGRPMISPQEVVDNKHAIQEQVQSIGLIDFEHNGAKPTALMLDNANWLNMGLLDFLRDVLPHFSVNEMVKRDTFRERLQNGLSLSLFEFMYPTLQGFDFLYLHEKYGCVLQVGGNDQWTNILDGIDLIRRRTGRAAYGLTFPLLMDRGGRKMGKTAEGETVWLARTGECSMSPFNFYQFWVKTPDNIVGHYLRLFTFLELEEIHTILAGNMRAAQHRLAYEITLLVHGTQAAYQAQHDAEVTFGLGGGVAENVPAISVSIDQVAAGTQVARLLYQAGEVASLSVARRLIQQGAVRVNGSKVHDIGHILQETDFCPDGPVVTAMVRFGKGKALKVLLQNPKGF